MNRAKNSLFPRFLGLRKNTTNNSMGGIEFISPGLITGWVYSKKINLYKVKLFIDDELISSTLINKPRQDVNNAYGLSGYYGFALKIGSNSLNLKNSSKVKLFAVDFEEELKVEIGLLSNPELTQQKLSALFKSNIFGAEGHFDGINDCGKITGWAYRKGQKEPLHVWLQGNGLDPYKLLCNKFRLEMGAKNLPSNTGFELDLNDLPDFWNEKNISISFDIAGKYLLPQKEQFKVPMKENKSSSISIIDDDLKDLSYIKKVDSAPIELQKNWKELEDFRVFLDKFDHNLSEFESYLDQNSLKNKKNFIQRFFINLLYKH